MAIITFRRTRDVPLPIVAEPVDPPVTFTAFAADCRLRGDLQLSTDRLTDALNGAARLQLSAVIVESLADGQRFELPELTVERSELCIVVADGPRGDPTRRIRTLTRNVVVEIGPYHVEGGIHGPVAADPFANIARRVRFVPITDATVQYVSEGVLVATDYRAILVNVALASSVRPSSEPN